VSSECYRCRPAPHSFPTRRSSDLTLYSFRPTAGVLWRMRSAVSGIIDDIFADSGSGVAPLMKAVVLSDFSSLTEETYAKFRNTRSEEHTSELQSRFDLVCRLLLEK